jgi:hypothetical protein
MKKTVLRSAVALLAYLLTQNPVNAQAIFGSVQGAVTDATGAVVPGVRVTVRNMDTGVALTTESNSAGVYFVGEVRPGRYELQGTAPGFAQFIQTGFTVRVEDQLRIDVQLQLGKVGEKVEINAEAPLLQTEQTTLGKVIDEQSIKELPLSGRNAFDLVALSPGVQKRFGASPPPATPGDAQPRISGGRTRTGEFVVDGSSITAPRRGEVLTQPNLDAIQEFKVQTSGLSAEFGRTVGGVVNATLKSGTNQFHGNVFDYLENNDLNARNFFAGTVPKLAQNQFGGMVGGPVRKNLTFFFVAYEGLRIRAQSNFNLTVPTAVMRNGDFSTLLGARAGADALGNPVLANEIFDPASTRSVAGKLVRDPFAGNAVPASRFDIAGKRVLDLYPDPNLPGLTQNFRILKPNGNSNNRVDSRIDQRFTDRDQFSVHFSLDNQYADVARPFPNDRTGGHKSDFNRYKTASATWTRTLTPTTVNDVRVSFFRGYEDRQFGAGVTPITLGIPNLGDKGVPRFDAAGFESIGDLVVRSPAQEQFQVQDIATFVRGRHILKAGVDLRRFPINDLQLVTNGQFGFTTLQTGDPSSGRGGNVIASMLLGQVDSLVTDPNHGRFYLRSSYGGGFFQDDFKVSSTLTLNIGIRYDVETQARETRWNGSNFNLATGRVMTMRQLGRNYIQLTDKDNFAPRVGFAWRPFSKTVVRSHYGIFYIPLTGQATSGFDRFPQDQSFQLRSDGVNAVALLSNIPAPVPNAEGIGLSHEYRDANAPVGYFQQWNFDIQHQAPWGILAQASYSASVAKHLPLSLSYNQIPVDVARAAGQGTQAMRPYPNFGDIIAEDERGNSNYQSLQLSVEKRFASGLSFLVAYTFSKLIDDTEDDFGAPATEDNYNLRLEKGLSYAHFPHRFIGSGIYQLPVGDGKRLLNHGVASKLVGGWQLGWILTLQTGTQVIISNPTNTARDFSNGFRPNLLFDPALPTSQRTLSRWFNTNAFQAPSLFTLGNSPTFPDIQGPGLANLDLSLSRAVRLPLTERSRFDIRADCFDCFNHPNFNEPSGVFGTSAFGVVTTAFPGRVLQVSLKFWF